LILGKIIIDKRLELPLTFEVKLSKCQFVNALTHNTHCVILNFFADIVSGLYGLHQKGELCLCRKTVTAVIKRQNGSVRTATEQF